MHVSVYYLLLYTRTQTVCNSAASGVYYNNIAMRTRLYPWDERRKRAFSGVINTPKTIFRTECLMSPEIFHIIRYVITERGRVREKNTIYVNYNNNNKIIIYYMCIDIGGEKSKKENGGDDDDDEDDKDDDDSAEVFIIREETRGWRNIIYIIIILYNAATRRNR